MPSTSKPRASRFSLHRRPTLERGPSILRNWRLLPGWHAAVGVLFFAGCLALILWAEAQNPYSLNEELDHPVFARVAFSLVDANKTEEARRKAQQEVPDHFRFNQALADRIRSEFMSLHAAVKAADSFEQFQSAAAGRWGLDEAGFGRLKLLTDDSGSERYKEDLERVVRLMNGEYLVEAAERDQDLPGVVARVALETASGQFRIVGNEKLFYATNKDHVRQVANRLTKPFSSELRTALSAVIAQSILGTSKPGGFRPVYVYDRELTRRLRVERAEAVPDARVSYERGDLLMPSGRVDGERMALLNAEHEEFLRQRESDPQLGMQWRKRLLGLSGTILVIATALLAFCYRFEHRIARNPTRALAIALLVLALLGLNVMLAANHSPIWAVGTVTFAAAMLAIAYSRLLAIGVSALLALLSVLPMKDPLWLLTVLLAVAIVTTLLLKEIRLRLRMIQVGGITAFTAFACTMVIGLLHEQRIEYLTWQAFWAALAALAGSSAVLILLPVIERAFRIVTSLTLLEWADTSNPLLKQLIQKAPGTWQHSHLLGSMAEAAAAEIGANGLLARVGAYYHDVGKMLKPQYFVENQRTKTNAHEGLAPTMSLLVILAHVKDGLALAREYGLPPVLHQFIAEHHGTTVVRYFHARAAQEAKTGGRRDREVSEAEFRYPGPKPHTPESAIIMLCDGVEGAVRAVQDPTPGRIENLVHDIVMARLMDGQLDDCDVTLRDISRIEQSIVRSLCAIHHGRIAYPRAAESPNLHIRTA